MHSDDLVCYIKNEELIDLPLLQNKENFYSFIYQQFVITMKP